MESTKSLILKTIKSKKMKRDVLKRLPKERLQKKVSTLKINLIGDVFLGLISLVIFLYYNRNNLTIEVLTDFKNNTFFLVLFIIMMVFTFFHRRKLKILTQELLNRD